MNKLVCSFALFLMAVALCSQAATQRAISIVHSGSWPPYADRRLPGQGLAIDLVTTAFRRAGYAPRVETATLAEILAGGETGAYDVFATPWYTADRDQLLHFSQPYLQSTIRFIKRKDAPFEYTKFDDLEGVKVGVIGNYAYDEDFNASTTIKKIPAGSLTENLRKLVDGEIDLTLDDERVLRYTLNQSPPDFRTRLELLATPLTTRGINIGVSRKHPEHAKIVADFDKAIAEMKQDGSYDQILQKHNVYIDSVATGR